MTRRTKRRRRLAVLLVLTMVASVILPTVYTNHLNEFFQFPTPSEAVPSTGSPTIDEALQAATDLLDPAAEEIYSQVPLREEPQIPALFFYDDFRPNGRLGGWGPWHSTTLVPGTDAWNRHEPANGDGTYRFWDAATGWYPTDSTVRLHANLTSPRLSVQSTPVDTDEARRCPEELDADCPRALPRTVPEDPEPSQTLPVPLTLNVTHRHNVARDALGQPGDFGRIVLFVDESPTAAGDGGPAPDRVILHEFTGATPTTTSGQVLGQVDDTPPGWEELMFDLSPWAGHDVWLVFEAEVQQVSDRPSYFNDPNRFKTTLGFYGWQVDSIVLEGPAYLHNLRVDEVLHPSVCQAGGTGVAECLMQGGFGRQSPTMLVLNRGQVTERIRPQLTVSPVNDGTSWDCSPQPGFRTQMPPGDVQEIPFDCRRGGDVAFIDGNAYELKFRIASDSAPHDFFEDDNMAVVNATAQRGLDLRFGDARIDQPLGISSDPRTLSVTIRNDGLGREVGQLALSVTNATGMDVTENAMIVQFLDEGAPVRPFDLDRFDEQTEQWSFLLSTAGNYTFHLTLHVDGQVVADVRRTATTLKTLDDLFRDSFDGTGAIDTILVGPRTDWTTEAWRDTPPPNDVEYVLEMPRESGANSGNNFLHFEPRADVDSALESYVDLHIEYIVHTELHCPDHYRFYDRSLLDRNLGRLGDPCERAGPRALPVSLVFDPSGQLPTTSGLDSTFGNPIELQNLNAQLASTSHPLNRWSYYAGHWVQEEFKVSVEEVTSARGTAESDDDFADKFALRFQVNAGRSCESRPGEHPRIDSVADHGTVVQDKGRGNGNPTDHYCPSLRLSMARVVGIDAAGLETTLVFFNGGKSGPDNEPEVGYVYWGRPSVANCLANRPVPNSGSTNPVDAAGDPEGFVASWEPWTNFAMALPELSERIVQNPDNLGGRWRYCTFASWQPRPVSDLVPPALSSGEATSWKKYSPTDLYQSRFVDGDGLWTNAVPHEAGAAPTYRGERDGRRDALISPALQIPRDAQDPTLMFRHKFNFISPEPPNPSPAARIEEPPPNEIWQHQGDSGALFVRLLDDGGNAPTTPWLPIGIRTAEADGNVTLNPADQPQRYLGSDCSFYGKDHPQADTRCTEFKENLEFIRQRQSLALGARSMAEEHIRLSALPVLDYRAIDTRMLSDLGVNPQNPDAPALDFWDLRGKVVQFAFVVETIQPQRTETHFKGEADLGIRHLQAKTLFHDLAARDTCGDASQSLCGNGWYLGDVRIRPDRVVGHDIAITDLDLETPYDWRTLDIAPGSTGTLRLTLENHGAFLQSDMSFNVTIHDWETGTATSKTFVKPGFNLTAGASGTVEFDIEFPPNPGIYSVLAEAILDPEIRPGLPRFDERLSDNCVYLSDADVLPISVFCDAERDPVPSLVTVKATPILSFSPDVSPRAGLANFPRTIDVPIFNDGNVIVENAQLSFEVVNTDTGIVTQQFEWAILESPQPNQTQPYGELQITPQALGALPFGDPGAYKAIFRLSWLEGSVQHHVQAVIEIAGFENFYSDTFQPGGLLTSPLAEGELKPLDDAWRRVTIPDGPEGEPASVWHFGDLEAGRYPDDADAHLLLPPVDLSSAREAHFSIMHRHHFEPGFEGAAYDGGRVEISLDAGTTWTALTPRLGFDGSVLAGNPMVPAHDPLATPGAFTGDSRTTSPESDGWYISEFDLSDVEGLGENGDLVGKSVLIRLRAATDRSVGADGWLVNNIQLVGHVYERNVAILPDERATTVAPGTAVTLSGTVRNFGPLETGLHLAVCIPLKEKECHQPDGVTIELVKPTGPESATVPYEFSLSPVGTTSEDGTSTDRFDYEIEVASATATSHQVDLVVLEVADPLDAVQALSDQNMADHQRVHSIQWALKSQSIEYENLRIHPPSVSIGQPFQVSFDVHHLGTVPGTAVFDVRTTNVATGTVDGLAPVEIAGLLPGERRTVEWTLVRDEPGLHRLDMTTTLPKDPQIENSQNLTNEYRLGHVLVGIKPIFYDENFEAGDPFGRGWQTFATSQDGCGQTASDSRSDAWRLLDRFGYDGERSLHVGTMFQDGVPVYKPRQDSTAQGPPVDLQALADLVAPGAHGALPGTEPNSALFHPVLSFRYQSKLGANDGVLVQAQRVTGSGGPVDGLPAVVIPSPEDTETVYDTTLRCSPNPNNPLESPLVGPDAAVFPKTTSDRPAFGGLREAWRLAEVPLGGPDLLDLSDLDPGKSDAPVLGERVRFSFRFGSDDSGSEATGFTIDSLSISSYDVEVQAIQPQVVLRTGANKTYPFVVTNTGAAVDDFTIRVVPLMSNFPAFFDLGLSEDRLRLEAGESTTVHLRVRVPEAAGLPRSGLSEITLEAASTTDPNRVGRAVLQIGQFEPVPLPDLSVRLQRPAGEPDQATEGETVTFLTTVENLGTRAAPATDVFLFACRATTGDLATDIAECGNEAKPLATTRVPTLPSVADVGFENVEKTRFTVSTNWATGGDRGEWHVVAIADAAARIAQYDRSNDIDTASQTINAQARPDIKATGLQVTDETGRPVHHAFAGDVLTINGTIENAGLADAENALLRLSNRFPLREEFVATMPPGQRVEMTAQWVAQPGNWVVVAQGTTTTPELDARNNVLTWALAVRRGDVEASIEPPVLHLKPGQTSEAILSMHNRRDTGAGGPVHVTTSDGITVAGLPSQWSLSRGGADERTLLITASPFLDVTEGALRIDLAQAPGAPPAATATLEILIGHERSLGATTSILTMPPGSGELLLDIVNRGTGPESISLHATGPQGWDIVTVSPRMLLEPGDRAEATFRVRTPAGTPPGDYAVHISAGNEPLTTATVRIVDSPSWQSVVNAVRHREDGVDLWVEVTNAGNARGTPDFTSLRLAPGDRIDFDPTPGTHESGESRTYRIRIHMVGGVDASRTLALPGGDSTVPLDRVDGRPDIEIPALQVIPARGASAGDPIRVEATIKNAGDADAVDLPVRLWVDGQLTDERAVDVARTGQKTVSFVWQATAGDHVILVSIGPTTDAVARAESASVEPRDGQAPGPVAVTVVLFVVAVCLIRRKRCTR